MSESNSFGTFITLVIVIGGFMLYFSKSKNSDKTGRIDTTKPKLKKSKPNHINSSEIIKEIKNQLETIYHKHYLKYLAYSLNNLAEKLGLSLAQKESLYKEYGEVFAQPVIDWRIESKPFIDYIQYRNDAINAFLQEKGYNNRDFTDSTTSFEYWLLHEAEKEAERIIHELIKIKVNK